VSESHLEIRREYMELDKRALGIIAEINKLQMELKAVVQDLARLGGKFINAAEAHGTAAVDELEVLGGHVSKKTVTYAAGSTVAEPVVAKRACSICRKPGHKRTTCPEAHLHREKK